MLSFDINFYIFQEGNVGKEKNNTRLKLTCRKLGCGKQFGSFGIPSKPDGEALNRIEDMIGTLIRCHIVEHLEQINGGQTMASSLRR